METQVGWVLIGGGVWEEMEEGVSKCSVGKFQGTNKILNNFVEVANLQKDSKYGQSRGITT